MREFIDVTGKTEDEAISKALAQLGLDRDVLDNDAAGRAALARLRREFGDRVMDKSTLYPDNKDLNDYLMSLYPKKSSKLKL